MSLIWHLVILLRCMMITLGVRFGNWVWLSEVDGMRVGRVSGLLMIGRVWIQVGVRDIVGHYFPKVAIWFRSQRRCGTLRMGRWPRCRSLVRVQL